MVWACIIGRVGFCVEKVGFCVGREGLIVVEQGFVSEFWVEGFAGAIQLEEKSVDHKHSIRINSRANMAPYLYAVYWL